MEALQDVIGIMDMDGFCVNKKFFCKELGILRVGNVYAKSYLFNTNLKWNELDEKTKWHCLFLTRNIHHLPFDGPHNVFPKRFCTPKSHELDAIVLEFYQQHKVKFTSKIAYKGGHYEKDMLDRLSVN